MYAFACVAIVVLVTVALLIGRLIGGEKGRERSFVVIPADAEGFERLVRAVYMENKFREPRYRSMIFLLKVGGGEAVLLAEQLAGELDGVEAVMPSELPVKLRGVGER